MRIPNGYAPVATLPESSAAPSGGHAGHLSWRPWRFRAPLAVTIGLFAVSLVVLAVFAALAARNRRNRAGFSGETQELLQASWLDKLSSGAQKACADATGFLHMSIGTTLTDTTTTISTTQTSTSTSSTGTTTTFTTTSRTSTTTATTTSTTRTSITSTSEITTSSTRTTTSRTSTPWHEALAWVGCFEYYGKHRFFYQNTLPKPYGYTSSACASVCRSFKFYLLREEGRCVCLAMRPRAPDFAEVPDERCGSPCALEETLRPMRRCGMSNTFAVYRIQTLAEVRSVIHVGSTDATLEGERPSWPRERRGATPDGRGTRQPEPIIKGISYGPVPLKAKGHLPDDDFMSHSTEALWGSVKGRGDLNIIRALGANTVRLYGNDPRLDHTAFLDEAMAQGLQVITGLSDYPYTQMPGNCITTNFDCYAQVKEQYLHNLRKGFLTVGNVYHPALHTVILMNEPDLKFQNGPFSFCKALVSAFDAALDAERELGIVGQAPAFTTTFSFGVCPGCTEYGDKPAIGQMVDLRSAMMQPERIGYNARNNLWEAYQARFVNSVNTANPAQDIRRLFLDLYDRQFPDTPVFIGEYHNPRTIDQQRDLELILDIAADKTNMLQGIAFFEFQVRYDKGGSEESFGMFGLDHKSIHDLRIGKQTFSVWCLKPREVAEVTTHMYTNRCGPMEVGMDYISESTWGIPMDRIPTPEICCEQCAKEEKCQSWTWVEDARLSGSGIPSQCWLKGGLPVGKVPKDGVISGIPLAKAVQVNGVISDAASIADIAAAQVRWGQCGGEYWSGPTVCEHSWRCEARSMLFSQCMPPPDTPFPLDIPDVDKKIPSLYVHIAVSKAFGGEGVGAEALCPIRSPATTMTRTTTIAMESSTLDNTADQVARAAKAEQVLADDHDGGPLWFGCFKHPPSSEYVYQNEQAGFTSELCIEGCKGFEFALLHNGGYCSCGGEDPRESHFKEVFAATCGRICPGEDTLTPSRYCGAAETFAVYLIP